MLRNLEGVRRNKPILKSEVSSIRSRLTAVSTCKKQNVGGDKSATLAQIEEGSYECCEICSNEIVDDEDLALNEEINRNLYEEENVKASYNEFRTKRGLAPIDFS